jgi:hypothetical protein
MPIRRDGTLRIRESWPWLLLPLVIGLVTPSLVIFLLQVWVGGRSTGSAMEDIATKQFAPGGHLFLFTAWSLIPFLLLSCFLLVLPANFPRTRIACLSIFGLMGILGLMVPVHWEVWAPLYDGRRMSSTAVIVFVPLPFLCLITMFPGLAIGSFVSSLLPAEKPRGQP